MGSFCFIIKDMFQFMDQGDIRTTLRRSYLRRLNRFASEFHDIYIRSFEKMKIIS